MASSSSVAGTLVTGGSCNGNPCNDPESHSQPRNGNESGAAVVPADDPGGRDQAEQEHNGATSSEDSAQGSAPRPRPTGTTEDKDIHPATNSNSKSRSRGPSAFTCNSAASLRLFWGLHHPHLVAAARHCERFYTACRHFSISIAFLAVQFSLLCYGLSLEGASREEIENGTFLEVLYLRFVFSVLFGLLGFGLLLHPNARVLVELGTQGASRLWTCGAQRLGCGRAAVIVNAVEDNNSGSASGDQVQVTAERAEALGEEASFRSADSGTSSLGGIDNDQGDTVSLSFVDVAEDTRNSSVVRAVPLAARKSHTLSDEKTPDPPEVVDAESRRAPAPNTKAASWKRKFHDLHDSHERSLAALLLSLALLEFAVVFLAQDHGSSYDRHGKLNFLAYLVVVPLPLVLLLPITQPKKWRWKFAAFSLYALVVVVHCAVTLPQWVRLWPKGVGVDLDFAGSHSPPTASSECRVRETIPWVMAVPFRMNFLFSDTKCRQRGEPSAAAPGGAARFTLELRARENMLLIHLQPRTRSNNAANNYNSSEQLQQDDSGSTGTSSSSTSTASHFWRMRALALQRELLSRHMRSECRTTLTAPIGSTQTAMFLFSKHGGETRTEYTVQVGRGETGGGAAVVDELESEPLLPLYVEEHNRVVYNSANASSSGQHPILDTSSTSRTTSSAQHTYHDTDAHSYFAASSRSHSAQLFANAENTTTALFVSVRKSWTSTGWENRTNRTGTGSGTSVTSSSTTLPHRSSSTANDEQLQQLQHHVALLEYALQDLQEEEDQRHFAIAHPRIGHGMFFKVFCDDPATVQYLVTQPTSAHFFKPFNHLPVLLLVIDAIGRAEAVRKLPKTFSLLKQMHERASDFFRSPDDAADADNAHGNTSLTGAPARSSTPPLLYDFVRHSSTGFATYQNVAGMFYGSTAYDLHRCNAFWTYSSGSKLISPQMNETDWLRKRLNDPAVGTFQHGATHPTMGTGITSSSAEEGPVTLRYMGDLGLDVAELISPWVERDLWDPDNPFDILNGGPYSATVRCLGGRFSHAWQLDSASLNGRQENDAKRLTPLSNSNTSTSGTSGSSNATSPPGSHQAEQIVNASEVSTETPSRPFDRIAADLFAATATAEDVHLDENMNVQQGRFAVAIHWFLEAHEVTRAVVETMDDDLHAFFVQAQSSGLLNSTAVFLVSDHGNHLGAYPAVFDNGFVEMSNPMLLMSLPQWWVERFRVAGNLLRNRQEFSTHFDLYETLLDIVRTPLNATELVPQLSWADGFSSAHGRSLLRSRVSANAGTPWANMPGLDPDRVSPRPDLRTLRKTCMCEQCELFEI